MPKRALFIVNRKSRAGTADTDSIVARWRQSGMTVFVHAPVGAEHIPSLIRRHLGSVDCVLVGGGDGTMNAAAQALAGTRVPLGVLPMGTANDLARTLKIPVDLEQAAEIACGSGIPHAIDLGCVNGHYFFNVANIGLGVHVTRQLSPDLKRRWGILSYARGLVSALRSFRPFHAGITCDGRQRRVHSLQIAVGNGRYYGGGMAVSEAASIDDHLFSLYSIAPHGWWEMLRFAPAFRAGRFEEHHPVLIEEGKHIVIVTRKPMAISADGEIVARTPAHFTLMAGAIMVLVPPAYFDHRQELHHVAQG